MRLLYFSTTWKSNLNNSRKTSHLTRKHSVMNSISLSSPLLSTLTQKLYSGRYDELISSLVVKMNTFIGVFYLAFAILKLSDADLLNIFRQPQCLLHFIHTAILNETYTQHYSGGINSPVVIQSLKRKNWSRVFLSDRHIRRLFLRWANVKRSFTQSCYIQFYDVDSLLNGIKQSNQQVKTDKLEYVLRNSVLPHYNWAISDSHISPNFVFFAVSNENTKLVGFDNLVGLL